jgi:hypothetical protein
MANAAMIEIKHNSQNPLLCVEVRYKFMKNKDEVTS